MLGKAEIRREDQVTVLRRPPMSRQNWLLNTIIFKDIVRAAEAQSLADNRVPE